MIQFRLECDLAKAIVEGNKPNTILLPSYFYNALKRELQETSGFEVGEIKEFLGLVVEVDDTYNIKEPILYHNPFRKQKGRE